MLRWLMKFQVVTDAKQMPFLSILINKWTLWNNLGMMRLMSWLEYSFYCLDSCLLSTLRKKSEQIFNGFSKYDEHDTMNNKPDCFMPD